MKVAVLTSSRADYSIYYPLLKRMVSDPFFELSIIAFGTHVSPFHGHTVDNIYKDGFHVAHTVESIVMGDSPEAIATSIGTTITKFSALWAKYPFDLVIALGDRFEMFAAVTALLPFGVKVAHLHGGETTLGAIDNAFRHAISLMSTIHFVSTDNYKQRLSQLLATPDNIFNVGALSIETLKHQALYTTAEFADIFKINLDTDTILFTFHPETVQFEKNREYIKEVVLALKELEHFQVLITMPNIDTMGNLIREELLAYGETADNVTIVESLGLKGYLSAMKHCKLMLGNSSSGFVEASYFPAKVVNIGNRQDGRLVTPNIFNCAINKQDILNTVKKAINTTVPPTINAYGDGNTSQKIVDLLKNNFTTI